MVPHYFLDPPGSDSGSWNFEPPDYLAQTMYDWSFEININNYQVHIVWQALGQTLCTHFHILTSQPYY